MARSVTVAVPATSANMGPGFDSLGVALDLVGRVTLSADRDGAPRSPDIAQRMAIEAACAVYSRAGTAVPAGLDASISSEIPVGRGLGASAVLRVGAAVAANELLERPLDDATLLQLAAELEGHADNVAPALFGGFQVVVMAGGRATRVAVPIPLALRAVILVPAFEMPTEASRRLLPASLSRADAVHNIGRAALLVAALATGDLGALRVATEDVLHQPARSRLFPQLFAVIDAAVAAGAACAYLSGGGSCVLALSQSNPEAVGEAMRTAAGEHGAGARLIHTCIRTTGATIVEREGG